MAERTERERLVWSGRLAVSGPHPDGTCQLVDEDGSTIASGMTLEAAQDLLAAADLLEGEAVVWWSFCPECGPNVPIDEDGCCVTCGATATGSWLEMERARAEGLSDHGNGR